MHKDILVKYAATYQNSITISQPVRNTLVLSKCYCSYSLLCLFIAMLCGSGGTKSVSKPVNIKQINLNPYDMSLYCCSDAIFNRSNLTLTS